jgi:mannose-6-phosphate isomerase-like protein (cupin superfamily)
MGEPVRVDEEKGMARAGDTNENPLSGQRLDLRGTAQESGENETNGRKEKHMFRTEDVAGTPASEDRRYYNPIQKDWATFLRTSEETGGEYTLIEVEVAAGGGNTPHYHRTYDEHFEVLEGALEVMVGKETRTLRPGEKAVAKKNTLHRFRNTTGERTKFLVGLRPGHTGFEKAIKAAYGLASDGRVRADGTPRNPYHLALLLEWSDIRLPGLLTVAEPVLRFLARRARRKGIDRELEAKYGR